MSLSLLRKDHLSHMLIHGKAEKTDATNAHISAHREAYFQMGQYERDMAARQLNSGSQQSNIAQNQIANQDASMNNNNKSQPSSVSQVDAE